MEREERRKRKSEVVATREGGKSGCTGGYGRVNYVW